jgi:hypothetical protein
VVISISPTDDRLSRYTHQFFLESPAPERPLGQLGDIKMTDILWLGALLGLFLLTLAYISLCDEA